MRQARQGIAIVMVLLISAVVLMTFLFASATLTISSRNSVASSRESAQALLAADSGLNTLVARAAYESAVTPKPTNKTFTDWIAGTPSLNTLDLGNGVTATLSVLQETANSITVQSVGKVESSSGTTIAQRTVVQEFSIKTIAGPDLPASVSVPGALTSVASITGASEPRCVVGKEDTVSDWEVTQIVTDLPSGQCDPTFAAVTLCDARLGEYVNRGTDQAPDLYKITGPTEWSADWPEDCSTDVQDVELTPVGGGANLSEPGSTAVTIRPTAITERLQVDVDNTTSPSTYTSTVHVTSGTASLFGVGKPITIGSDISGCTPYTGTVQAVNSTDSSNPQLTIKWDQEGTCIPGEGSVVRREISSGVTSGSICGKKNKADNWPNGCDAGVSLPNLFNTTFGVSKDDLYNWSGTTHYTGGGYQNENLSGITWVCNASGEISDEKGSGILIIDTRSTCDDDSGETGSVKFNTNANHFTGLIYVIGDADIEGNFPLIGAVVVDGTTTLNSDVDTLDPTKINGNAKIYYDPLQLINTLSDVTFPNPNQGSSSLGQAERDTWRIR